MKPHDHKAIQQFEANGRDHEQIQGSNVRRVVSQKGFPPLTGRSTTLDHVLGDARLRDLKPDLEQLTVHASSRTRLAAVLFAPTRPPSRKL
jgi:hypothetical protein